MVTARNLSIADFRGKFKDKTGITKFPVADYPDDWVDNALVEAKTISVISKQATLYVTAHLLILRENEESNTPDGGSGVVISEDIGPQAMSYAPPQGRQYYERTYYGRAYLELERRSPSKVLPRVYG